MSRVKQALDDISWNPFLWKPVNAGHGTYERGASAIFPRTMSESVLSVSLPSKQMVQNTPPVNPVATSHLSTQKGATVSSI